jgi:hypothetical protein
MIDAVKIRYGHTIRIAAVMLLLVNGISALAAGYAFVTDPTGRKLGITTAYLRHSPFDDFFIPGIILFLIIGLMSVIISVITLLNGAFYPFLISLQGAALLVWILAQMAFLGFLHPMHLIMIAISVILILAGYFLKDFKR